MRRWLLSFGVLLAAIVAGVGMAAWWQPPWIGDSLAWLTGGRDHAISERRERALKPKDTFRECQSCPEMVVVPAGEFMMGWPATQAGTSDNEGPQHKVTIGRPFAVARFELTFAEWDACVAQGGCPRDTSDQTSRRPRQPVINVSWNEAKLYVAWLSKITGKPYRLLSEAEWEYAARAGSTARYASGDDEAGLDPYAWYSANANNRAHPVGEKAPNAFGLFDMHGNVWEWVEDCYHEDYEGAPVDGAAWTTGACEARVLRGGAFNNTPPFLRPAYRLKAMSVDQQLFFGIRIGRTLVTP
jgi:formylglycine-generating enzyme required for sulfatase activity